MADKFKDNRGFRSGKLPDIQADTVVGPETDEAEPVDFGAALSEIENSHPELIKAGGTESFEENPAPHAAAPAFLGGAAMGLTGTILPTGPTGSMEGVALTAIAHPRDPETVDDEPMATEMSPESLETLEIEIESPIGGYDMIEARDDAVLLCALLCHNVTKALNDSRNEYTVPWEDNKASVLAGVRAILENPKLTPEESHGKWVQYKTAEGWVYGPIKDAKAKTHPCMVPYALLGAHQQSKDAIFGAIVRTFFGL